MERINKDNFDSKIGAESGGKLSLVDFYSDTCIPCKKLNPVLSQIESELGEKLNVYKLNVTYDMPVAEKYNVQGTPTLILFKDGKEQDRKSGFQKKEDLLSWLKI